MGDVISNIADSQKDALKDTDRILKDVRAERARQFMEWGWGRNERDAAETDLAGLHHDDGHGPGDWTRFIVRHLGRAEQGIEDGDLYRWRDQLVRVAALAVAGIEAFERHDRESIALRQEQTP